MNLWIIVGDAGGARIYSLNGRTRPLNLLRTLTHERSRAKESEINTDRAGRNRHGPVGRGLYGTASSVRVKDVEAQHFAREVAGVLGNAFDRREFDTLALTAPARFLGILTDALDPQVKKRVLVRVDKDLTHTETRELPDHLGDVFLAVDEEQRRRTWSQ